MSGLNAGRVGIAGEVRCVIKREDGSIKEDTGFQKNLILNQGLDFFGGDNGIDMFSRCVIGSGNTIPVATQTQLASFLAITTGEQSNTKYDYVPVSSNLYKANSVFKYTFTGLDNVNVSEVGLVSNGTTSLNYYLCTRALLKDSLGAATAITILLGETLEVYYKLWVVVSTLDANYVINMLDGKGGSVPYNAIFRPSLLGTIHISQYIGKTASFPDSVRPSLSDLVAVTNEIPGSTTLGVTTTKMPYTPNSYKLVVIMNVDITGANTGVRSVTFRSWFLSQMRFGSVANDSLIPKTGLQTLSMPFEISWGRYEGVL